MNESFVLRKGFIWALIVIGLFDSQTSEAGPITFNTALPVAARQGILRGQYVLFRASGDPTTLDRSITVQAELVTPWLWAVYSLRIGPRRFHYSCCTVRRSETPYWEAQRVGPLRAAAPAAATRIWHLYEK